MEKPEKRKKAYQIIEGSFVVAMFPTKAEAKKYVKSIPKEYRQNATIEPIWLYKENPFKEGDRVYYQGDKQKCGVIVGKGGYLAGQFKAYPVLFDNGKEEVVFASSLSKEH